MSALSLLWFILLAAPLHDQERSVVSQDTAGMLRCTSGLLQDTPVISKVRPVSLQNAVDMALQNYPAAQRASIEVAKQEALQKTAFDPSPATVFYQQEETNGNNAGGIESWGIQQRSEEHTSELQSLMRISYAVFCLKKKKTKDT